MEPRSKRIRKRPGSEINELKEDPVYETTVRRLELDGKPISAPQKWLRVIKPYPYTYSTFAKGRWEGRTILDVYCSEFGSYPRSYYETAIRQGRILVSDKQVSTSYIIKGGDVLSHTVHLHEPGVAVHSDVDPYVTIIKETPELVIVEKPGTMAVHPCGGYNMQSLVNIVERYYRDKSKDGMSDIKKLYTIHRLDRLTSGLVILGKTSSVARSYSKYIMNRSCQKIYLARVAGKFPLKYRSLEKNCSKQLLQSGIPLNGEWNEETSIDNDEGGIQKQNTSSFTSEKDRTNLVSRLRKQNALACWIEDGKGTPIFEYDNGSQTNMLEQIFHCRHSVDEWLQSIDKNLEGREERDCKLWYHLACPTRVAKHKNGVCEAGSFDDLDDDIYKKTVKPAHSSFGVVSYDETTDSTLLICRPYTGRSHQLRLHLQHLQHSIANDPNYGGEIWYGNPDGKEACKIAQDRLNIINSDGDVSSPIETENSINQKIKGLTIDNETSEPTAGTSAIDGPATESEVQDRIATAVRHNEESIHSFIERTCVWCARSRSKPSEDRAVLEFVIRSSGIWLHALQYSFTTNTASNDDNEGGGREVAESFRTELPDWHDMRKNGKITSGIPLPLPNGAIL
eukprot:CAMPEP_0168179918 /NCGR_PEP_ID=MMETSP0139_2-20121125/10163_1 /TAXON_ID=44445 /ORGANISM="Pseudo-nitzschia australis, Strain 10249 10 AB" /LENGTH=622 /DNA_ID=CAMNT_0008099907 /DNA_START=21 /DNA_END=1889 /DNA_ORIENTATION=-